jgi:hypothetical protein
MPAGGHHPTKAAKMARFFESVGHLKNPAASTETGKAANGQVVCIGSLLLLTPIGAEPG